MDINIWDKLYELISSQEFYIPVITICLTFLIIRGLKRLITKLITKNAKTIELKRKNTIVSLAQNIIKYVLIIFALLIILSTWGVNVTGLITGLGVAGVVAGLALQDALKDIIMGCNIIMDNYFVVGDLVTFNGFTGEVIEFGLKNTKIKSVDGSVFVVANREINQILNLSQKSSTVVLSISVAYEEKEDNVKKVLDGALKEIDKLEISTKKSEYLGIDSLKDSSVEYMIKAYCRAGDQYELKRKSLSIIKKHFDNNNIKIPYPQIEVHNGKRV
ncbi:MAG: mechanosensitive ion channel family protein [Bacilli bacterium]|nr:mechanosensitive ion channel family protein [Bacilli bacterium]